MMSSKALFFTVLSVVMMTGCGLEKGKSLQSESTVQKASISSQQTLNAPTNTPSPIPNPNRSYCGRTYVPIIPNQLCSSEAVHSYYYDASSGQCAGYAGSACGSYRGPFASPQQCQAAVAAGGCDLSSAETFLSCSSSGNFSNAGYQVDFKQSANGNIATITAKSATGAQQLGQIFVERQTFSHWAIFVDKETKGNKFSLWIDRNTNTKVDTSVVAGGPQYPWGLSGILYRVSNNSNVSPEIGQMKCGSSYGEGPK